MTITSHHTAHPHTGPLPIAVPKRSPRTPGRHRLDPTKDDVQFRVPFLLKIHGYRR